MAKTIADVMVTALKESGVRRVYGIPGDTVNGFMDALRRDGEIIWEKSRRHRHLRHRPGQPRLRRHREVRRAVRRDSRQGRRTRGRAASGVRARWAGLVDVRTARQELALPPKLTFGQIKGFTLYATRTILSGGGEELVELTKTNLRELVSRE